MNIVIQMNANIYWMCKWSKFEMLNCVDLMELSQISVLIHIASVTSYGWMRSLSTIRSDLYNTATEATQIWTDLL